MTKTLTEQWKDGELPDGTYYIRCVDVGDNYISCNEEEYEKIDTYSGFDEHFIETNNDEIVEVLAPVPSYDEHKQLVSKTEQLEKKLEMATKALKRYSKDDYYSEGGGRSVNPYPNIARKALKEMEGVK